MNINLKCDELKRNIVGQINNSGLPISLIYYMMKDLMCELDELNNTVIRKEREDALKEASTDEEELPK